MKWHSDFFEGRVSLAGVGTFLAWKHEGLEATVEGFELLLGVLDDPLELLLVDFLASVPLLHVAYRFFEFG